MERTPASSTDYRQIWSVSDGRAGNARQADALAGALATRIADAAPPSAHLLAPRAPWRWLAPRRLPASAAAFGAPFAASLATPPALAIGCGRQAALATRLLRARGAFSVQILDPRLPARHWDLLVVPAHDGVRGANILNPLGSLHPVDDAWLALARARHAALAALPGPRTAVLIGGSSRHVDVGHAQVNAMADLLDQALAADGGSVLVTTSRRTPPALRALVRARMSRWPGRVWCDEGDGDNPYAGFLAWADRIVCSPDSVNMVSEACATHVPVHVFAPASVSGAPGRFLASLLDSGRIRPMDATLAAFDVVALRETARIAAEVAARLPR